MEEQKGGGSAATATIEDNTFEALEKDFQEVLKIEKHLPILSTLSFRY